jgi:hypothetical protein
MASIRYAARYRCDFCGKIADVEPPPAENLWPEGQPPGWLLRVSMPGKLAVTVTDIYNQQFTDFCDDCVALPISVLLEMLQRRLTPPE